MIVLKRLLHRPKSALVEVQKSIVNVNKYSLDIIHIITEFIVAYIAADYKLFINYNNFCKAMFA